MQVAVPIMHGAVAQACVHHRQTCRKEWRAYKALGALAAVPGHSDDLCAQLVELVVDLLQAGQVVLADGAVLAAVHHYQLPPACGRPQLNFAPLQQHALNWQQASPSLSAFKVCL